MNNLASSSDKGQFYRLIAVLKLKNIETICIIYILLSFTTKLRNLNSLEILSNSNC